VSIAIAVATVVAYCGVALAERAGSGARSLQAGWIDAGHDHSCAVLADGSAACWGSDFLGQLGNGPAITDPQPTPSPVALPAGRRAVSIAAGGLHACAILDDGSAACWGYDAEGQLGNGPGLTAEQPSPSPVALPLGRTAVAISAGNLHTCAILDDGSAACWGSDGNGQLGNGAVTGDQPAPSPVALPPGRTAVAITAGHAHTCAVLDDGSAACWGFDALGEVGDGSGFSLEQPSPSRVALPPGRTAVAISAGDAHTCALLDDGSAACWGVDATGQLGNGAAVTGSQPSPTAVALPPGRRAVAITAGGAHTCATLEGGSVACWGLDDHGQLGNGPVTGDQASPAAVALPLGRTAVALTAGSRHACAVLDDGSAVCWGLDDRGQLGNGAPVVDQADPSVAPLALPPGGVPGHVADLSVAIEQAPGTLAVGERARVVVRVANRGPDPATGVVLALRPELVAIADAIPAEGTVSGREWLAGTVAAGSQTALVVDLTASAAGSGALTAELTGAREPDPDSRPGNDRATEDDQATANIVVTAPAATAGGQTPGARTASSGKLRPRGLTVTVTRMGRRLVVSGRLALPPRARCHGRVLLTTRLGTRRRVITAALRRTRRGCVYRTSLAAASARRATVVSRFTGNAELAGISARAVLTRRVTSSHGPDRRRVEPPRLPVAAGATRADAGTLLTPCARAAPPGAVGSDRGIKYP
jgi:alpha-tubulin suppressor-like RCC1 family protein